MFVTRINDVVAGFSGCFLSQLEPPDKLKPANPLNLNLAASKHEKQDQQGQSPIPSASWFALASRHSFGRLGGTQTRPENGTQDELLDDRIVRATGG